MKASSPNGTQGDAYSSPAMNRSGRWYSFTTRSRLVSLMADTSISVVVVDGYQHLDDARAEPVSAMTAHNSWPWIRGKKERAPDSAATSPEYM